MQLGVSESEQCVWSCRTACADRPYGEERSAPRVRKQGGTTPAGLGCHRPSPTLVARSRACPYGCECHRWGKCRSQFSVGICHEESGNPHCLTAFLAGCATRSASVRCAVRVTPGSGWICLRPNPSGPGPFSHCVPAVQCHLWESSRTTRGSRVRRFPVFSRWSGRMFPVAPKSPWSFLHCSGTEHGALVGSSALQCRQQRGRSSPDLMAIA